MLPRIVVDANRVAITRPGYDVLNSPVNFTTHAMHSSFTGIERPILTGVIRNASVNSQPAVSYGATYSQFPFVMVNRVRGGQVVVDPARSSDQLWQSNFGVRTYKDRFQIDRPIATLFIDPDWDTTYDWHYVVFAGT